MGLASADMLLVSQELEEVVRASLYPTLLFEHTTIDSLARHLDETYGRTAPGSPAPHADPHPAEAPAQPARPHRAQALRPVWTAAPTAAPEPADLIVIDAAPALLAELAPAVAAGGGRLVAVHHQAHYAATGPDSYRLDTRSREQLARMMTQLPVSGGREWAVVHAAGLNGPASPPRPLSPCGPSAPRSATVARHVRARCSSCTRRGIPTGLRRSRGPSTRRPRRWAVRSRPSAPRCGSARSR